MRKLILRLSVSIDGYIDYTGQKLDFAKSRSPEGAAWVSEKMSHAGAHLVGRKTFCEFVTFWPKIAAATHINEIPKIVFSKKGFDPSTVTDDKNWSNARVITGDLAAAVTDLKKQPGKDLIAHGGVEFARNLVETGLIDEYWLAVHPVAAGKGFGLFEKLPQALYLKLIENKVFPTGAMINIYRPE